MNILEILDRLEGLADREQLSGMARAGIDTTGAYGVSIPDLRAIAKEAGTCHRLAAELWKSGSREARIVAGLVDDPALVTKEQMESWAGDFSDWELCDQTCNNLFRKTGRVWEAARSWAQREPEFVKRAGFVLAAVMAVGRREERRERFEEFLPLIVSGSGDPRLYVRKAVCWALRQIGKNSISLNRLAIEAAERIGALDSKPARWISSRALSELTSERVAERLGVRGGEAEEF